MAHIVCSERRNLQVVFRSETHAEIHFVSGDEFGPQLLPYTLHPKSYTLHPKSYTLNPTPYTLNPTPYTLNPTHYILHPTLNPTPYTLNPTHYTLKPVIFIGLVQTARC